MIERITFIIFLFGLAYLILGFIYHNAESKDGEYKFIIKYSGNPKKLRKHIKELNDFRNQKVIQINKEKLDLKEYEDLIDDPEDLNLDRSEEIKEKIEKAKQKKETTEKEDSKEKDQEKEEKEENRLKKIAKKLKPPGISRFS